MTVFLVLTRMIRWLLPKARSLAMMFLCALPQKFRMTFQSYLGTASNIHCFTWTVIMASVTLNEPVMSDEPESCLDIIRTKMAPLQQIRGQGPPYTFFKTALRAPGGINCVTAGRKRLEHLHASWCRPHCYLLTLTTRTMNMHNIPSLNLISMVIIQQWNPYIFKVAFHILLETWMVLLFQAQR